MGIRNVLLRLHGAAIVSAAAAAFASVTAQDRGAAAPVRSVAPRWMVVAPDAALAWFTVLADLRLAGAGALDFTAPQAPGASARPPALAHALEGTRDGEILHFVPLYHPSADRAALAAALRGAVGDGAPSARATLLTGALRGALTPARRRDLLPPLADALLRAVPDVPDPAGLATWQRLFDAEFGPALAPWLRLESLDEGRLIVAPGIGPEGRIFSATADRRDNLVAVGSFAGDADVAAPLYAFTREVCFPAVTRAARAAQLDARDPGAARRASVAAVRCGAALLDLRLPSRAAAYRSFWSRRIAAHDATATERRTATEFDRHFPPDAAFTDALARELRRLVPAPGGP